MMSNKRRFQPTDSCAEPSKSGKRAKSNSIHKSDLVPNQEPFSKKGGSTVIQQLKKTLGEFIRHPGVLQGRPEHSSILSIAAQLQDALKENLTANSPSASIDPTTTDVYFPELPRISDASLEQAVFIHPGVFVNNGVGQPAETSYDRLEVLGDAYIEVIATKCIWQRFPGIPAGRICQIREEIVKNETLAEYATRYGLDKKVSVVPEHKSQTKRWLKIKADVFEAYIAAVILSDSENGYEIVEKWLWQLWLPKLTNIEPMEASLKYKELLAKKIMGKGIKLKYVDERPPAQAKGRETFYIGVYLTGWGWENQYLGSGFGSSKAIAGDSAAKQALNNVPLIDEVSKAKIAHDNEMKNVTS
ncbi:ribonuclease III domain-containing protein [Talaromyces proteolyticus]|uniref:Ribonuclease III domain-containing protein n=1 Tax=Talaromyces proteolyticus TaxID=1131652 RepID=A0AAD4L450_9EURO|nr:ribonuclease III domain-containing protein [Talaromyces proteolyticus]KAH8704289.1 ribonuclease III domain-containing protein [Talaromyces proteolyticus]